MGFQGDRQVIYQCFNYIQLSNQSVKTQKLNVKNSNCSKLKYQRVEEDKFWKEGNLVSRTKDNVQFKKTSYFKYCSNNK